MTRREFGIVTAGALAISAAPARTEEKRIKPVIKKLGTIDLDLVETCPIVFKNRVYRFEYVRTGYWNNKTGDSYFRFIDHASGAASPPFAQGFHLGSAMADDDMLIATGTNIWDGERVDIFVSRDMEHWETWNALNLPGYGIFNTSLCKADDRYVLMFEIGKPEEFAGAAFTARFATSKDLHSWELTPPECNYAKDRYTAPHCLRSLDGYFYDFYLESSDGGYDQRGGRSKDLIQWEPSPLNPVLKASDEDKQIANPSLTPDQIEKIKGAKNINNSDIDFCEFEGRLIINYSWG
ncbi:MAG: hypothetical protein HYV26_12820, partial [Candidatus Hydrogenedentes bacterium]|nr:hypothetical protein [Candidatus Hydrogenedentota bacterium]